jgi:Zn-dependent M28 family amino/carboxypeptidase
MSRFASAPTRRRIAPLIAGAAIALGVARGVAAQDAAEFSADRFKAHVVFLADDLLEGREAGTRGHEIAAKYVASQLAQLGVKPAAPDGSYFEPVQLLEWLNAPPSPTLTISGPQGTQDIRDGVDAVIVGSPIEGPVDIQGPLVFAGYGVVDRALGQDDYSSLDVRGKIVVVFVAPMTGVDSEVAAHDLTTVKRAAAEHGAIGFIGIQTRTSARTFPFELRLEMRDAPSTTWVRNDGTSFDPGYGIKASAYVSPKAAATLFEGAARSLEQLLDEVEKPGSRPAGFPLTRTAKLTVNTRVRRYESPDVIGMIEGSDPTLKNEFVVLMAHADHIGISVGGTGDRINNGALDNAAGVATLLEVARAVTTGGQRPKRSLLVVANTAEEKGLLGAEYLAHYPPVPIDRIVAAVDMDMPLLLYDFTNVVAYGGTHSTVEKAFRAAGAEMNVALSADPMPEQAIFVRSDHYSMAKAGVPAVMLATGMANGGEAAWSSFLQTVYHHPGDDLSQPIRWQAGARFAELNYRAIRILADSDEPARWYAGDYFGNLFAPNAKKAPKP